MSYDPADCIMCGVPLNMHAKEKLEECTAQAVERGYLVDTRPAAVNGPKTGRDIFKAWDEPLFPTNSDVEPRLTTNSDERKGIPLATGVIDYFPDALIEVARLSKVGNDKHNPGQPLHWARGKSDDHPDCLMRHFVERGTVDTDGIRHSAKVAWRALAILQLELEEARTHTRA